MKNKKKGFTLVELIVVLAILAILAAMLVPALTGYIDKANEKKVVAAARQYYVAAQTVTTDAYASNVKLTSIKANGGTNGTTVTEIGINEAAVSNLDDVRWDEDYKQLAEMKKGDTAEFAIDKDTHKITSATVVSAGYKAVYTSTTDSWAVSKSKS